MNISYKRKWRQSAKSTEAQSLRTDPERNVWCQARRLYGRKISFGISNQKGQECNQVAAE